VVQLKPQQLNKIRKEKMLPKMQERMQVKMQRVRLLLHPHHHQLKKNKKWTWEDSLIEEYH
jgi:calcineurin-like phosphoesterase family protein